MKKTLLILSFTAFGYSFAFSQIITTVAGNYTIQGYSGDGGQATAAELGRPYDVSFDASGNLYIADYFNYDVRAVNTSGIISTFAGIQIAGYFGDGGQATAAKLNNTSGISFDAAGNAYIADAINNRVRVVNTSGVISTIAGNGTAGYSGDGGQATAAELHVPFQALTDGNGNVYFSDYTNNVVRMINSAGIISTIAGNGTAGYSGDGGQATAAELKGPSGIAFDPVGNLYICDQGNNRVRLMNKLSGVITTITGNGVAGSGGDGGLASAASVYSPFGVLFDQARNFIYITEYNGDRIRVIDGSGIINTLAGTGISGYSGDGGPATAAKVHDPAGMTLDASGNLYVADALNAVVRKITGIPSGVNEPLKTIECSVYPNPVINNFTVQISNTYNKTIVTLYNLLGQQVLNSIKESTTTFTISIGSIPNGIYFLKLQTDNGNMIVKKLEVSR